MTFPNRPFPESTPLFPLGSVVERYILDHVDHFKLAPHIHVQHQVTSMTFSPLSDPAHPWVVRIQRRGHDCPEIKRYSTVILASGITPIPNIISWSGQDEWLKQSVERRIMHSMWYRSADFARGRCVVVIGYHPSGAHIAMALSKVCREVSPLL